MLTNETSVARFTISSSVTDYEFNYQFWDLDEISVTATNEETGTSVILKRDIDYTLTVSEGINATEHQGGTISMISNTYLNYTALIISRELPYTQETDYKNSEPINADIVERSLDRLVALLQQVKETLGHTLQMPITDVASNYVLPNATDRASKILGFSSDGLSLQMYVNLDDGIAIVQTAIATAEELKNATALDRAAVAEDKQTVLGYKNDAEEAANSAAQTKTAIDAIKTDVDESKEEAEDSASQATSAKNTALQIQTNISGYVTQMQGILDQVEQVAASASGKEAITVNGTIYTVSKVISNGLMTVTLSEAIENTT